MTQPNVPADVELRALLAGNGRYVSGQLQHPNVAKEYRAQLAAEQHPRAVILCCSDSRVVPELIFDCGLGDLFTIRVAGNIVGEAVLGSVEYAVVHLSVNLVVVMGHQSCGAVTAALSGDETQMHIDELVRAIRPAVERAKQENPSDLLDRTARLNVEMVAEQLSQAEPILCHLEDRLKVVSAYYHLDTGQVELLDYEDS